MSCGCCCTKTLDLCKVDACSGQVDLNIHAQSPGEHRLVMYFLGSRIVVKQTFAALEKIVFDVTGLNENHEFIAEVYDPGDNRIVVRKNGTEYNCIKFRTILTKTYV